MEGEQHGDRLRDRERDKGTWIEKGRVRVSSPDRCRDNEKPEIRTHRKQEYDAQRWTEDESQTEGEMEKACTRLVTLGGHPAGSPGRLGWGAMPRTLL